MQSTWKSVLPFLAALFLSVPAPGQSAAPGGLPAPVFAEPEGDSRTGSSRDLFEPPVRLMVGDHPLNAEARQMYPSPAMFDVDGDGAAELIVGDIFGSLNVYENRNTGPGDPLWSPPRALESADAKPISVSNW